MDLVKENAELRERCADLDKQLWDLCAKHGELLTQLEELRAQRLNPRAQSQGVGQTVAEYTKRDGTRWAKIRTGWNTYVHRQVA
jgi:phage gp16-like protein